MRCVNLQGTIFQNILLGNWFICSDIIECDLYDVLNLCFLL